VTATFAVSYAEIALKGRNRPEFARALRRNIRRTLSPLGISEVRPVEGRFIVEVEGDPAEASLRLEKVFGVAWFSKVAETKVDYVPIRDKVLEVARGSGPGSFKIEARRSDKSIPFGSMELARRLGAEVQAVSQRRVDLSHPDTTISVDLLRDRALVYSDRKNGPGGLPVGTGGRVVLLFSGGIDSPVAAWLLMKRGCTPVYLHFYLAPGPEYPLSSKVPKIVGRLTAYSGKATLILVPFADYQLATIGVPGELEPSLFRRFMRMTAEQLAERFLASAIGTGDSLAQAASQTLTNIGVFDHGSTLPILRPLLSYDKEEIVRMAKSIGSYQLSIEEYRDCCAIITRHPRTRSKLAQVDDYVERLGLRDLARKTLEKGTVLTLGADSALRKVAPLEMTVPAS
jgi:tRNA uracil 4-sulfurtransferase